MTGPSSLPQTVTKWLTAPGGCPIDTGVTGPMLSRAWMSFPAVPGSASTTMASLPASSTGHIHLARRLADAAEAAAAIADLDGSSYRGFNLFIADNRDAFWVRSTGEGIVDIAPIPDGVSMLTAHDLNDVSGPRTGRHLPRFRAAPAPEPDQTDSWFAWAALLASRDSDPDAGPGSAMLVGSDTGFGTVSSSLMALPAIGRAGIKPQWLFNSAPRDKAKFAAIPLD